MANGQYLSKEQIKEAFNLFDADGSGAIDAEEMKLVLGGLGFQISDEAHVRELIRKIDTDQSGVIEFAEFEKVVEQNMARAGSDEEIWRAWTLFTQDPHHKKGRITFADLRRVAHLEDPTTPDDHIHRVLRAVADPDDGGYPDQGIVFAEWQKALKSVFTEETKTHKVYRRKEKEQQAQ
eukprot:TRINITY_DN3596_c5_g1_i1.p1 TRINITY_DN3596_c5_g1~~TRINITY_DN3596_c5_g1_i1.p1  ORF type:complete len:208 (+),score=77.36 TRINITY_DN3596_c5_g1_i1:88-624(+)